MKLRKSLSLLLGQLLALSAVLTASLMLFGQDESVPQQPSAAALGGMLVMALLVAGIFYIYVSLALQTIAKKTQTENAWMAWIPIVNVFLMLSIAGKPLWWFILCLIPLVNIIILIVVWMGIAEARSKPSWWGILTIVPFVGIIVPGYLAWSE